jgi:hypothetical protein
MDGEKEAALRACANARANLRQQGLQNISAHIGQAIVTSFKPISEFGVIDAHAMQERGMEVVDVDGVFDDVVGDVVSFATLSRGNSRNRSCEFADFFGTRRNADFRWAAHITVGRETRSRDGGVF